MTKTINNFKTWISQKILERGEEYWSSEMVDNLVQNKGTWSAEVFGSEDIPYDIEVEMEGEEITAWFCDCPYDYGPICKHVVAVLYEIKENGVVDLEEVAETPIISISPKQKKPKAKNQNPVAEIIDQLEETELRTLLNYFAKKDGDVRAYLLTHYTNLLPQVSKSHFKKIVANIISAHTSGGHGFIEYRQASNLGHKLCQLLTETGRDSEMARVYLAEEVLKQTTETIGDADDSSGMMGAAIAEALEILDVLAEPENESPEEIVNYIFELAKTESAKSIYGDYGGGSELRALAVTAARGKDQIKVLLEAFDKFIEEKRKEKYSDYEVEQAEKQKYRLIQEWFSKEEAEEFLASKLEHSSFREMALEKAFAKKDFEEAKKLAKEGVMLDTEKRLPGLVKQWKKWLIKIAEATGDKTVLIEMNEQLFLERGEMEYYRILKKIIPPQVFEEKIAQYLKCLRGKENARWRPMFNHQVAGILEEENRWKDLIQELEKDPNLRNLDQYFQKMGNRFPDRFSKLYAEKVQDNMEEGEGRSLYKECCDYLHKIVKLGHLQTAEGIAEKWKKQFPRRRAMLEELKKAGF